MRNIQRRYGMIRSDRPLPRKLIRLAFQAMGRSCAHRQDLWPGLRIDKGTGDVFWHGQYFLRLESALKIIPPSAPMIAVVGSGPSLKNQRVEALGDETAILCNGAALLAKRIRPLAVAVEDERFIFRHHAMLADLPHDIPLLLSPAALRAWAERDPEPLQQRTVAMIDNLAKPVNARRRALSNPVLQDTIIRNHNAALSLNPDHGVVVTGTIAFSALQFALVVAPKHILLAGIDLSNDNQPRFYEAGNRAPSRLSAGLDRILAGFALAQEMAKSRGIRLTCASPVSALLELGYPEDRYLT